MFLTNRRGFTLTEVLIAIVLTGLIVLAVTSVDITSRKFLAATKRKTMVQDEAKIAMEHIVGNVQLGIGDVTNSPTSNGLEILDSGTRIRVKIDGSADGQYIATHDRTIEYRYNYTGDPANTIVFIPDIINNPTNTESLTDGIIAGLSFAIGQDSSGINIPNQVDVNIVSRRDPSTSQGLDNPETTLTSSIVLRAMSIN